jgi:hypothetical protein
MEPSSSMVMVDVCDLYFFVVKTAVGGKRVCILGYAKFFVRGMQLVSDKKWRERVCIPKRVLKTG